MPYQRLFFLLVYFLNLPAGAWASPTFSPCGNGWSLWTEDGQARCSQDGPAVFHLDGLERASGRAENRLPSSIQFISQGFSVSKNSCYRLEFNARASMDIAPVSVALRKNSSDWRLYSTPKDPVSVGIAWAAYEIDFISQVDAADARIDFSLGSALLSGVTLWIDSLRIVPGCPGKQLYTGQSGVTLNPVPSGASFNPDPSPARQRVVHLFSEPFEIRAGRCKEALFTTMTNSTRIATDIASVSLSKSTDSGVVYYGSKSSLGTSRVGAERSYLVQFVPNVSQSNAKLDLWLSSTVSSNSETATAPLTVTVGGLQIRDCGTVRIAENRGWQMYANPTIDSVTGRPLARGSLAPTQNDGFLLYNDFSGVSISDLQLFSNPLSIEADQCYSLEFDGEAQKTFTIPEIRLMQNGTSPTQGGVRWENYFGSHTSLSPTVVSGKTKHYRIDYIANATKTDARITFALGKAWPNQTWLRIDRITFDKCSKPSMGINWGINNGFPVWDSTIRNGTSKFLQDFFDPNSGFAPTSSVSLADRQKVFGNFISSIIDGGYVRYPGGAYVQRIAPSPVPNPVDYDAPGFQLFYPFVQKNSLKVVQQLPTTGISRRAGVFAANDSDSEVLWAKKVVTGSDGKSYSVFDPLSPNRTAVIKGGLQLAAWIVSQRHDSNVEFWQIGNESWGLDGAVRGEDYVDIVRDYLDGIDGAPGLLALSAQAQNQGRKPFKILVEGQYYRVDSSRPYFGERVLDLLKRTRSQISGRLLADEISGVTVHIYPTFFDSAQRSPILSNDGLCQRDRNCTYNVFALGRFKGDTLESDIQCNAAVLSQTDTECINTTWKMPDLTFNNDIIENSVKNDLWSVSNLLDKYHYPSSFKIHVTEFSVNLLSATMENANRKTFSAALGASRLLQNFLASPRFGGGAYFALFQSARVDVWDGKGGNDHKFSTTASHWGSGESWYIPQQWALPSWSQVWIKSPAAQAYGLEVQNIFNESRWVRPISNGREIYGFLGAPNEIGDSTRAVFVNRSGRASPAITWPSDVNAKVYVLNGLNLRSTEWSTTVNGRSYQNVGLNRWIMDRGFSDPSLGYLFFDGHDPAGITPFVIPACQKDQIFQTPIGSDWNYDTYCAVLSYPCTKDVDPSKFVQVTNNIPGFSVVVVKGNLPWLYGSHHLEIECQAFGGSPVAGAVGRFCDFSKTTAYSGSCPEGWTHTDAQIGTCF